MFVPEELAYGMQWYPSVFCVNALSIEFDRNDVTIGHFYNVPINPVRIEDEGGDEKNSLHQ
jgi:hypothetical protein